MQLLLENGANVNPDGDSPLLAASKDGYEEAVQLLLESGANVDVCYGMDGTPLFEASRQKIVQMLLEKGALLEKAANVDIYHYNHGAPPHAARKNGREMIVQLLLEREATINPNSCSPLLTATKKRHWKIA